MDAVDSSEQPLPEAELVHGHVVAQPMRMRLVPRDARRRPVELGVIH